jgi:hypothetical protein
MSPLSKTVLICVAFELFLLGIFGVLTGSAEGAFVIWLVSLAPLSLFFAPSLYRRLKARQPAL